MIRAVIALFVFAVFLCGWIVLRGFAPDETVEVTRSSDQTVSLAQLAPAAQATAQPEAAPAPSGPSALRRRLAAQGKTTLEVPPGRSSSAAAQMREQDSANNGAIEAAVMAALAPVRAQMNEASPAPTAPNGDALGQSALAGILAARGMAQQTAAPAPQEATQALGAIVAQALQQGQSDAYVEALLQAAHSEGMFEADRALVREDGRVDARTMLSQIVGQASPTPSAATPENVGGAGVEVRTVQRADRTETYRFYTVQGGDSLGYIAQKFYGDAALYPQIWEANRTIVPSPDRIQKGQRLVIPNITS